MFINIGSGGVAYCSIEYTADCEEWLNPNRVRPLQRDIINETTVGTK